MYSSSASIFEKLVIFFSSTDSSMFTLIFEYSCGSHACFKKIAVFWTNTPFLFVPPLRYLMQTLHSYKLLMKIPIYALKLSNHQISFRYELSVSTLCSRYFVQRLWFVIYQGFDDIKHAGYRYWIWFQLWIINMLKLKF